MMPPVSRKKKQERTEAWKRHGSTGREKKEEGPDGEERCEMKRKEGRKQD